jgi:hypothetical protein
MRWRQTLAPLCAATLEHQPAILRGHTGAKTMRLGSTTIVRLKCSLRHSQLFSTQVKSVRLTARANYVKKAGAIRAFQVTYKFSTVTEDHGKYRSGLLPFL